MDQKLYAECEEQFRKITEALEHRDTRYAHILAWRMMMKLEEIRLRHPYA